MTEDSPIQENEHQRLQRAEQVVRDYYRRLAAGESISEDTIIKAHPDLMPELGRQLATVPLIEEARVQVAGEETGRARSTSAPPSSGGLQIRCPFCHTPMEMAVDTPITDIVCSTCGSHFSLVDEESGAYTADTPRTVGRFELSERLGFGGFGTVWRARDTELDRTVAVKIPRKGQLTPAEVEHFLREARTAAQLKHPNVVGIHEVGRDGDTVYIVSDLVEGVPLSDWLQGRQVSVREAATLCCKIAGALHHAHQMGVIHRDLKPQNVLIDDDSEPQVTDFGLARRELGEATVTIDGQLLGTPAYMSPEQAEGQAHEANRRSDVYSLGVILFELLTGELPFRGNVRMLLHQVIHDEPPSPRRLNSTVSRDLETICLKCLEKDARRRYCSAQEFADELHRYLRGEPIRARPLNRPARLWRWCKRYPMAAMVVGLVLLLALIGPSIAAYQYGLRKTADRNLYQSLVGQARAVRLARESGYRRKVFDLLERALEVDTPAKNLDELRQEAVGAMGSFVGLEPTIWQGFSCDVSEIALHPALPYLAIGMADGTIQIRNLADGSWIAGLQGDHSSVSALAFDPKGDFLTSGDDEGRIRVWRASNDDRWVQTASVSLRDEAAGDETVGLIALAVGSGGDRVVACHNGGTKLTSWSFAGTSSDTTVDQLPAAFAVRGTKFSHDGLIFARGQQSGAVWEVLVWDVANRRTKRVFRHDLAQAMDVSFSPDDRLLLYSCGAGVGIYDLVADRHSVFLRGDCIQSAAVSRDNRVLAVACPFLDLVRLWSIPRDREIGAVRHIASDHPVHVVSGKDGHLLVTALDRAIHVWSLAGTGERWLAPDGHDFGVPSVAFNRQGTMLATAGDYDHTVQLWNMPGRERALQIPGFDDYVQTLAFSHDDSLLATGDWAGQVRLWDVSTGIEVDVVVEGPASNAHSNGFDAAVSPLADSKVAIWAVAFSDDGQYLAVGGDGIQVWRIRSNRPSGGEVRSISMEPIARPTEHRISALCFSPDNKLLAWCNSTPSWSPSVWDLEQNRLLCALPTRTAIGVYHIAFFPDSDTLTFVSADRTIEQWHARSGRKLSEFSAPNNPPGSMNITALSGDGQLLAWAVGSTVTIWDAQQKRRLLKLPAEPGAIWYVTWSPDNQLLALGTSVGGPVIWDMPEIRRQLAKLNLDW